MFDDEKKKAEAATPAKEKEKVDTAPIATTSGGCEQGVFNDDVLEDESNEQDEALNAVLSNLANEVPDLELIAGLMTVLDEEFHAKVFAAAKQRKCKGELQAAYRDLLVKKRKKETEERGLIPGKAGEPLQIYENIRRLLSRDERWEGVFAFNEFDGRPWVLREFPGDNSMEVPNHLRDEHELSVLSWVQSNGFDKINIHVVHSAVVAAACANKYHPVRDYLDSLKWDEQPRIDRLFDYYFDCKIEQGVPGFEEYLRKAGARFLIGAVRRMFEPGCKLDHMPVVSGPQGKFKSTAFKILCGEEWFGDDMPSIDNKDAKDWLRGKWFGEVAEMASMTNRDVDKVKVFMATTKDSWRKAYGRNTEDEQRQSILCGTVNGDEYLVDSTGGRRFWPIRLDDNSNIRIDELKEARDQLWAEAVHRYRAGEKHWFDQGESPALEAAQEDARTVDIGEEKVRDWLARQPQGVKVSSARVAEALFPNEQTGKGLSMRVSRYMKSCGWEHGTKSNGTWLWQRGPRAACLESGKPDLKTV